MHPEIGPKQCGEYTDEELEKAKANTEKFHYNQGLFSDAVYESDDTIPKKQIGTIVVFPEISEESKDAVEEFISKVFGDTEAMLGKEYDEPSDPTMFWEYGCDGMHFSGTAVNPITGDKFGPNSPTIYIAGCKDGTADYLIETAIDNMYRLDSPYQKKRKHKNGENNDSVVEKPKSKVGFKRFKSFLIYNVGSGRFYQFGTHENHLYHRAEKSKSKFDAKVYEMFLPSQRNAF